jgi:hypothetical protein
MWKPSDHSLISASSSSVWTRCPASPWLARLAAKTTSPDAQRGTHLHGKAAGVLKVFQNFGVAAGYKALDELPPEEQEVVAPYVKGIFNVCPDLSTWKIEAMIGGRIHPEAFGTVDFCGRDDEHDRAFVVDFKTGGNEVLVKGNTQLLYYAAQMLPGWSSKEWWLGISQPAVSPQIIWWVVDRATIQAAEDTMAQAADRVFGDDRPPFIAGDHCRNCKANGLCTHGKRDVPAAVKAVLPAADVLAPTDMAKVVGCAAQLRKWLDDVEELAMAEAAAGRLPGFALVDGKKRPMAWTKGAEALVTDDAWYDRKLKTPAQAIKDGLTTEENLTNLGLAFRPTPNKTLAAVKPVASTTANLTEW